VATIEKRKSKNLSAIPSKIYLREKKTKHTLTLRDKKIRGGIKKGEEPQGKEGRAYDEGSLFRSDRRSHAVIDTRFMVKIIKRALKRSHLPCIGNQGEERGVRFVCTKNQQQKDRTEPQRAD